MSGLRRGHSWTGYGKSIMNIGIAVLRLPPGKIYTIKQRVMQQLLIGRVRLLKSNMLLEESGETECHYLK